MSLPAIPKLQFFPLYPGGPVTTGGGLTASSSFYTNPTGFSDSYAVNIPTASLPATTDYWGLGANGTLTAQTNPTAINTVGPLGISYQGGGLQLTSVQAPTTVPDIPVSFQTMMSQYGISNQDYATMMAQPSFELSQLGIQVITDGHGGVSSMSIMPSYGTVQRTVGATSPLFVLPDRTQITQGAVPPLDVSGYGFLSPSDPPPVNQSPINPPAAPANTIPSTGLGLGNLANGPFKLSDPQSLKSVAGQSLPGLQGAAPLAGVGPSFQAPANGPVSNPLLDRLLQLQPQQHRPDSSLHITQRSIL